MTVLLSEAVWCGADDWTSPVDRLCDVTGWCHAQFMCLTLKYADGSCNKHEHQRCEGPVRLGSHLLRRSGDHSVLSGVLYGSHLWRRRCSRFVSFPSWAVMKCLSCFQSGCSLWQLNVFICKKWAGGEGDDDCLTGGGVHLLRLSSSDVVVSWFRWCWAVDVLCAADVAAEWSWHPLKHNVLTVNWLTPVYSKTLLLVREPVCAVWLVGLTAQ